MIHEKPIKNYKLKMTNYKLKRNVNKLIEDNCKLESNILNFKFCIFNCVDGNF